MLFRPLQPPSAVALVTASTNLTDGVQLSWRALARADSYELMRGGSSNLAEAASPAQLLGDAVTNLLDITAAERRHYWYWVRATNRAGPGRWSQPAAGMALPHEPQIVEEPQGGTVPLGGNLTLRVVATGDAPLSYQWRKDGGPVAGATDARLELTNVQANHGGANTVVVSNRAGAVTSVVATVTVGMAPTFVSGSSQMTLQWVPGIPGTRAGAYVGRHEVTMDEYLRVMGSVPNGVTMSAKYPVTHVSRALAVQFCHKMTLADRPNGSLRQGWKYILTTTEQWQAFAGPRNLAAGVTSIGNGNLRRGPAEVESKSANTNGLFDVWGNVSELTDTHRCGLSFKLKALNPPLILEPVGKDFPGDEETGFRVICVQE